MLRVRNSWHATYSTMFCFVWLQFHCWLSHGWCDPQAIKGKLTNLLGSLPHWNITIGLRLYAITLLSYPKIGPARWIWISRTDSMPFHSFVLLQSSVAMELFCLGSLIEFHLSHDSWADRWNDFPLSLCRLLFMFVIKQYDIFITMILNKNIYFRSTFCFSFLQHWNINIIFISIWILFLLLAWLVFFNAFCVFFCAASFSSFTPKPNGKKIVLFRAWITKSPL